MIVLPPAPRKYDRRDQNELRRRLQDLFRQINDRLTLLEAA